MMHKCFLPNVSQSYSMWEAYHLSASAADCCVLWSQPVSAHEEPFAHQLSAGVSSAPQTPEEHLPNVQNT